MEDRVIESFDKIFFSILLWSDSYEPGLPYLSTFDQLSDHYLL
jgi:hypothetical protein